MKIPIRVQGKFSAQEAVHKLAIENLELAETLFEHRENDLRPDIDEAILYADLSTAGNKGRLYFELPVSDASSINLTESHDYNPATAVDSENELTSSSGLSSYEDTAELSVHGVDSLGTLTAAQWSNDTETTSYAAPGAGYMSTFATAKPFNMEATGDSAKAQPTSDPNPASEPGAASTPDYNPSDNSDAPSGTESDPTFDAGTEPDPTFDGGAEPEPDPAPAPDNIIFDPFTYAARAVLYAKNAVAENDAYGVKTSLLEQGHDGLEPATSGAPDSVQYAGGNAEDYLTHSVDAQTGEIIFSLTADGLAAITKAGAADMEFYYTITSGGLSYTIQVIMTAKDVFSSAEYHNTFTEFTPATDINEWHSGKTGIGKAYSITSGDSADYINLDTQLTAATLNSGAGNDHISVTAAAGKTVLDNNTTITLGAGRDSVIITAVNSSATSQAVAMNKSTLNATGDNIGDQINITGTIKTSAINAGDGNDTVSITTSVINGVAVDASSNISLGNGDDKLDVNGRVISSKITAGDGADDISLRAEVSSAGTPALNTSEIDLGSGANQLNITAKGSTDTLYSLTAVSGSTLRGGNDGNAINLNGAIKSSALLTGDGNDAINIAAVMNGSANLVDNTTISLGKGADTLNVTAQRAPGAANVYALSKSTFDAREGDEGDTITISGQIRDSNILTGEGSDTLHFGGVSSTSNTTPTYSGLQSTNRTAFYELNVGDGDNSVSINYERDSASSSSRSVGVSGYDFTSGSGNDTLNITADYGVSNVPTTYTRAAEFRMGAGDDNFKVTAQYGGINKVNLDMGDGNDRVDISIEQCAAANAGTPYAAVENSIIDLGTGSDILNISTNGVNTAALKNSTVLANADDMGDKIGVTGTVRATDFHMGGGDDTLEFRSTVNINTSATGYAAHAGLHSGSATSHSLVDLGEGNNKLTIISEGTANHETDGTGRMGTVTTTNLRSHGVEGYDIFAGPGNDEVRIEADYGIYNGKDSSAGTRAESYAEINLGAGDDTLAVDSVYTAAYHTKINMGEGDDYARFSSYKGDFAVLHDVHVDMGSGNDTVEIDYANMVVSSTWWDAKNVSGDYTFDTIKAHSSIDMGDGNDLLMLRSDFINDSGKDPLLKMALPNDNILLDGGSNDAVSFDNMHSGDTVNVGDILGFSGKLAGLVSSANLYDHDIKNFESLLVNVGEKDTSVSLDSLLSFVGRLEENHANDIKSLIVTANNGGNMDLFNTNGHSMELSASNVHVEGLQGDFNVFTITDNHEQTLQLFLQAAS